MTVKLVKAADEENLESIQRKKDTFTQTGTKIPVTNDFSAEIPEGRIQWNDSFKVSYENNKLLMQNYIWSKNNLQK